MEVHYGVGRVVGRGVTTVKKWWIVGTRKREQLKDRKRLVTEYVNSRFHLNSFYCCRVLVESVVSSGNVECVCGLQGLPGSCGDPHASWTSHQVPAWVSSLVLITKGPSHWRTKQTNGANYGGLIRKLWGNWVMNGNIFVMRWSFMAKINFQKGPLCVFFWSLDLELDDTWRKTWPRSRFLSLSLTH